MIVAALTVSLATALHAAPAAPDEALRWGRIGHRAVAMVAAERLTPAARRHAARLLEGASLAEVSTWADSIRPDRPATSPWHYVNIPVIDSVYRPERHCPEQCVIKAYRQQLAILSDRRRPRAERAEALKWVVHLLEDLHMPLHVGDRGDRGGNDLILTFEGRRTNLHALWDYGMIEALGHTDVSLAGAIRDDLRRQRDPGRMARGDVLDWAMESHQLSRNLVYHALPASLEVDQAYLDIVRPALRLQLLRASVRLAAVLNRALGDG